LDYSVDSTVIGLFQGNFLGYAIILVLGIAVGAILFWRFRLGRQNTLGNSARKPTTRKLNFTKNTSNFSIFESSLKLFFYPNNL
jgi:hypothetical protein